MKKKILYVTSSRADFGIIQNFLIELNKSKSIKLYIIVMGTHNVRDFGYSYSEIKNQNFKNIHILKVNNKYIDDPSKYIQATTKTYINYLKKINPEIVILLGDRYEIAHVALMTHITNYPIIHFHGGEKTSGSKDDNYRHAISKLSQYHFVSHQIFKKRLIQLGENKKSIFNIGSLSLENISTSKKNIEKKILNLDFLCSKNDFYIISFHPLIDLNKTKKEFYSILNVIKKLKKINFVFTSPNQDPGYKFISQNIKKCVERYDNIYYYKNFGKKNFFYVLKRSKGIIGNSSAGIIEAPYLKKPTINIGERQNGRLMSSTIFNSGPNSNNIKRLILKISNINFKINTNNIYITKKSNISIKILNFIINSDFKKLPLNKNFIDLNLKR